MKLTQNDTNIGGEHDSCRASINIRGVIFVMKDGTKTVPMKATVTKNPNYIKSKEDYICAGCGAPCDNLGYCTNECDDYPVEEDD